MRKTTCDPNRGRWRRYLPLLILLAGVAAYANSFRGVFVLDDSGTVESNLRIRRVLPERAAAWLQRRSVGDFTFAVNYATGKLDPAGYHATNLAIHILCGLLLFGLVRRTLLLPSMAGREPGDPDLLAFWAAMLWTLHPLTTAAVTYVSQRYESLMALFFLLALYAFLRGAVSRRAGWYAIMTVAVVLGTASKEVMVVLPFVLIAYDAVFLADSAGAALRRRWWVYIGALSGWLLLAVSMTMLGGQVTGGGEMVAGISPLRYALTQCGVIVHYVRLALVPVGQSLDYGWPLVAGWRDAWPWVLLVAGAGGYTLWALRKRRVAGFLGFAFFTILAPTSSFAPRPDCAFEHRMYLPLAALVVGVTVLGGVAGMWAVRRRGGGRATLALQMILPALIAMTLGGLTYTRNRVYLSEEAVWLDVLRTQPDHLRAYQNLASAALVAGDADGAARYCEAIFGRLPDFSVMTSAELADAVGAPGGRDTVQAVFAWANAKNTLGMVRINEGEWVEAERCFRESLRLTPGNVRAWHNLATVLYATGRARGGVDIWLQLLAESPEDTMVLRSLGEAAFQRGDAAAALGFFARVVALDPDNLPSQARLAWILATTSDGGLRDGERALRLARSLAQAVGFRGAEALDILAAAYAEAGQFGSAVATAQLALHAGGAAVTPAIGKRLELYRKGLPYREASGARRTSE